MRIDAPQKQQIPQLRRLWQEAFGDTDAFLDTFAATAFSPNRCRCVSEGEETPAALYWFDCTLDGRRIAYLYAIATARAHRGRGLCRALMQDTHAQLQSLGYAGAALVPSSADLFGFYERLGYRTAGRICEFRCAAADADVPLRQIDVQEYAALRRTHLPVGGVVQEGENLAFLQTMADFYAGEDLLLAARREGDALRGVELLGNAEVAPRVVRALHCSHGYFRTPGIERPFVMWHGWEQEHVPRPFYFGLAFD